MYRYESLFFPFSFFFGLNKNEQLIGFTFSLFHLHFSLFLYFLHFYLVVGIFTNWRILMMHLVEQRFSLFPFFLLYIDDIFWETIVVFCLVALYKLSLFDVNFRSFTLYFVYFCIYIFLVCICICEFDRMWVHLGLTHISNRFEFEYFQRWIFMYFSI